MPSWTKPVGISASSLAFALPVPGYPGGVHIPGAPRSSARQINVVLGLPLGLAWLAIRLTILVWATLLLPILVPVLAVESSIRKTINKKGQFVRANTQYQAEDGDPLPGFDAQYGEDKRGGRLGAGRFHLIANCGCPWAHRTLIVRSLKQLKADVGLTPTRYLRFWTPFGEWRTFVPAVATTGWELDAPELPAALAAPAHVKSLRIEHATAPRRGIALWQLYAAADGTATGRVTVPVLWDAARGTIVNNESSQILRLLDQAIPCSAADADAARAAAQGMVAKKGDAGGNGNGLVQLFPAGDATLSAAIEAVNAKVYPGLNNGVYKAGFTPSEDIHASAVEGIYATLDYLNGLAAQEHCNPRGGFLMGPTLTEADIRAYVTLLRFDVAYYLAFRCSSGGGARIRDAYPQLFNYMRRMASIPEISTTYDDDLGSPDEGAGRGEGNGSAQFVWFYFWITRWEGRRPGTVLRALEAFTFCLLGAHEPLAQAWQWRVATLLTAPHRLVRRNAWVLGPLGKWLG